MNTVYGFRLGCDMDVAYTNLVLQRPDKEGYRIHKVLAMPHDPSEALQTRTEAIAYQMVPFLADKNYVIQKYDRTQKDS
jgi:hypothetical protein